MGHQEPQLYQGAATPVCCKWRPGKTRRGLEAHPTASIRARCSVGGHHGSTRLGSSQRGCLYGFGPALDCIALAISPAIAEVVGATAASHPFGTYPLELSCTFPLRSSTEGRLGNSKRPRKSATYRSSRNPVTVQSKSVTTNFATDETCSAERTAQASPRMTSDRGWL